MKKMLFLLCFCTSSLSLFGQTPVFEWATQLGNTRTEFIHGIATDSLGNIYVTGSFRDTIDFDPSTEIYNLKAKADTRDIFVAKYTPNGNLVWANSFGGFDDEYGDGGKGITIDSIGNVYVTGVFSGNVDFDPSPNTYFLSANDEEIFVLKLNTEGSLDWARSMGGGNNDIGLGITVDESGNVYTTGSFRAIADFDPGSGIYNLDTGNSFDKAFISKLNSEGDFVWAKAIGTEGPTSGIISASGISIAIDNDNNVYTIGGFNGTADFDPGPNQFNLSAEGANDIFISKLNSNGDFVWAKTMGGSLNDGGSDITVDESGNVYTTGIFAGTVDFDPGSTQFNLLAEGERDAFVLKLDTNGNFHWAKSIGGAVIDGGSAITLDKDNNIYTTGYFEGTVDFDMGPDSFNLTTGGEERNTYLLKLDSTGSFIWAGSFYGNDGVFGSELVVDEWNNIYTVGRFWSTADFDPDTTSHELTSNGLSDMFIQKMRQLPCTASPTISSPNTSFAICPGDSITLRTELPTDVFGFSYSWNTGQDSDSILVAPDSTSIYTLSVSHSPSCNSTVSVEVTVFDSIAILITGDIEVCEQEEISLTVSGGDSYIWSTGDTTSLISDLSEEDQIYSVTVTDVNGCSEVDSVQVLIVSPSDTTYMDITSCDSLAVGTAEFIYPDQNGCDSIVIETTTLILPPQVPIAPADLIIEENAAPFQLTTPEVPNATSYFWQVPTGVQILSGQNTNTITINWDDQVPSGSVCVSALNECGSSSADCMEITVDFTDALEEIKSKGYSIFPNPADDFLNVIFEDEEPYEIVLLDALGRIVVHSLEYVGQAEINISKLTDGAYWLKIRNKGEVYWERVEVIR